ncbi:MAG: carbon-nitrogen hydrolase family protein [Thiotrichaceae bacterium]|nr:carbon-nitrogen hydrolase family protein [Thiotrichaceae bacterium]
MPRVAVIQMASGSNLNANLHEAARLLQDAAAMGAELVVLPENFFLMGIHETDKVALREAFGTGKIQQFLAQQALKHKFWLVGGTIPLLADSPDKVRAACLVFNPNGQCMARYDKMHLFDVNTTPSESYFESGTVEAGKQLVTVATPFGKLGLAICYDLRFPELFRQLVEQGVEIFCLPSAFTALTGRAHWEVLVRARAIENLSFMIASNQGGYHVNGRETHGNSMIVDPWGSILTQLRRGTGVICSDIDMEALRALRHSFPVLQHRKLS